MAAKPSQVRVVTLRTWQEAKKAKLLHMAGGPEKELTEMPHIKLPEGVPGILGPMAFSPATAKPMNELAEVLLRSPNSLEPWEREMIATYVSYENDCHFCHTVHGATAAHHLGGNEELVDQVRQRFEASPISDKLKALLTLAGPALRL